jgi:hypothetical protein
MQTDTTTIQEAEAALSAKGIKVEDFQEVLALLKTRQQALDTIERQQQNQFYGDAFRLLNVVSKATQPDGVVLISQFLRRFAEHVATQTLTLQEPQKTLKDIVDMIPQLNETNQAIAFVSRMSN